MTTLLMLIASLLIAGCGEASMRRADESTARPAGSGGTAAARPGVPTDAPSLLAAGESLYAEAEYAGARSRLEAAMRVAAADSTTVARALTWLGLTAMREGHFADSRRHGEEALKLKSRLGLNADLFRSYNALGLLAHTEGRFGDAGVLFREAERAAAAVGDSTSIGKARGNLGLVDSDLGNWPAAREGFEAMRAVARAQGDARVEGNALTNLGMLAVKMGDPEAAVPLLVEARTRYRRAASPVGEENALAQLATAYDAMGEPQRAFAALDSALAIARAHGLRREEAEDLQLVAELYDELGDHARAYATLGRAAAIADTLGLGSRRGDIARSMARALESLGERDRAIAEASRAERLHENAGARYEQLNDLTALAELMQRARRSDDAARALRKAESLASALGSGIARAQVAMGAARVADAAHDAAGVVAALGRLAHDSIYAPAWERAALRARAEARLGNATAAVEHGRLAVAAVERLRVGLAAAPLRASLAAARSDVYADLVVALLAKGRQDEAFAVADAARGHALLEHLAAAGRDAKSLGLTRLIEAERLLRRIAALTDQLRRRDTLRAPNRGGGTNTVASDAAITRALEAAEREYEGLVRRAGYGAPPLIASLVAPLRNAATGERVVALRRALGPDEVLIEYLVSGPRLITFVITPERVSAFTAPESSAALAARVRLARGLLSRSAADDGARDMVLGALDELLLGPARRAGLLRGARTLVIVPHGPLVYLPFAALRDQATGRYVAQDLATLALPAAAALPALRARPRLSAGTATVVAPFPGQLPGSEAESRAVAGRLRGARLLVGGQATERAVRDALSRTGVLHVATHGTLNPRNPLFSRLELARTASPTMLPAPVDIAAPDGRTTDDGRLEVHELLGVVARNSLVFLSGCETGAGAAWTTGFSTGEDYTTLAQALLNAGAANVVATLWRVDDRAAAVFAAQFYAEATRQSAPQALAAAQRALLRDPAYRAPRHWAAYTVAGDGRATVVAQTAVDLTVSRP
jgi:tetratricopeptide (TPR) repeat protein